MEKKDKTKDKTKDTNKDNSNFVQMNRGYMAQMRILSRKSPVAMQIFLYLIENMGRTTNAVVCSYKVLGEVTNLSRTSVAKAIRILKEDSWIDAVKVGNATAYAVNERVVWQASRNQRKYAIFSAIIIASESEQDSDYHEKAKQKLTHIPVIESGDTLIVGNEKLSPPDQGDLDL